MTGGANGGNTNGNTNVPQDLKKETKNKKKKKKTLATEDHVPKKTNCWNQRGFQGFQNCHVLLQLWR